MLNNLIIECGQGCLGITNSLLGSNSSCNEYGKRKVCFYKFVDNFQYDSKCMQCTNFLLNIFMLFVLGSMDGQHWH